MKITKAVFPLGGLGSRMLPFTKSLPKEMLFVLDKPLIHYAVEEAIYSGLTDLIFVVRNQKKLIQQYFSSKTIESRSNIELIKFNSLISKINKISYVKQDKPLGLGQAIWCTKNIINNEPFAVLLPDDLIEAKVPTIGNMIKHFEKINSTIIAISKVKNNAIKNHGIVKAIKPNYNKITKIFDIIEKPLPFKSPSNLAVIGRYILKPNIFNCIENTKLGYGEEIQLTDSIKKLLQLQQPIYGYRYQGNRFDCGSKIGLKKANMEFGTTVF